MKQITADELSHDLNTIFDRVNRNHEIFSVMRGKNQAVVILDAEDYRRLAKQIYFRFPGEISQAQKINETFSGDLKALKSLILSTLHTGRITQAYTLVQKWEKTGKRHPLSEAMEKAVRIMEQHHLTDKNIEQAFRVLSDLLDEQRIHIQSADFSVKTYKGEDWIHYNYHLDLAKPELLPGLETELNLRLSSLPSDIFEALEIDISADEADLLCMTEDISEAVALNDALIQRVNEARQGMREGIPGLSYEEVFGE